jgi:hypothetical protein
MDESKSGHFTPYVLVYVDRQLLYMYYVRALVHTEKVRETRTVFHFRKHQNRVSSIHPQHLHFDVGGAVLLHCYSRY